MGFRQELTLCIPGFLSRMNRTGALRRVHAGRRVPPRADQRYQSTTTRVCHSACGVSIIAPRSRGEWPQQPELQSLAAELRCSDSIAFLGWQATSIVRVRWVGHLCASITGRGTSHCGSRSHGGRPAIVATAVGGPRNSSITGAPECLFHLRTARQWLLLYVRYY